MSDEKRIHFWEPDTVTDGDIVWLWNGNSLVGPLLVMNLESIGYGSNCKTIYKLLDTSRGSWHQGEKKWLRVPKEIA